MRKRSVMALFFVVRKGLDVCGVPCLCLAAWYFDAAHVARPRVPSQPKRCTQRRQGRQHHHRPRGHCKALYVNHVCILPNAYSIVPISNVLLPTASADLGVAGVLSEQQPQLTQANGECRHFTSLLLLSPYPCRRLPSGSPNFIAPEIVRQQPYDELVSSLRCRECTCGMCFSFFFFCD